MTIDVNSLKKGGIVSIRDYLLDLQKEGKTIARTESGDPSFDVPLSAQDGIIEALFKKKTHYTPGAGIPELRSAIVEKITEENKIKDIKASNVVITSGAMNALYVVFQAICDGERDSEILVPSISWTETFQNIELAGARPIFFHIDPFKKKDVFDIETIKDLITPRTKAIAINAPHNPTGIVLGKEFLEKLVTLCEERNLYLVSDEAYEHILYDGTEHVSPASLSNYDKIISIFSFSKSYAMSGLRVGYFVAKEKKLLDKASKYVRCTINGVNSISQYGAVNALKVCSTRHFENMNRKYLERRDKLFDALQKCSLLEPVLPQGAFYIWTKINIANEEQCFNDRSWDMTRLLLQKGIGSAPGAVFGPGGINQIRFSFSCEDKYIDFASEILRSM